MRIRKSIGHSVYNYRLLPSGCISFTSRTRIPLAIRWKPSRIFVVLLAKYRYKLREALELLIKVGFLLSYEIDARTDVLNVVRAPRRIPQQ